MITEFNGEEFTEHKQPCSLQQITHIEYLWGRVSHEIPKHLLYQLQAWFNCLHEMTYDEAEQLISELYKFMPNEYPIHSTEVKRAEWIRKNKL